MRNDGWGIIGHEWAVAALQRALAGDRIPHALLFVGPPGTGKRTLALRFAQALQCTAAVDARPCGQCRACRQIDGGAYPDVRLIETERAAGATRRDISIDQIRMLQHQVSLKPYEGRWAIGIIDGAHEMSDAAANCLLKTLEEPQRQVVLMLTAPDANQLLPTIVSRCQVFNIRPLPLEQVQEALATRSSATSEQAAVLAHLSGGRIGWALRAAQDESVLAVRREQLEALRQMAAATRRQRIERAGALAEDYGKGQDGREAVHETLDLWATWWRDVLLVQQGCTGQATNVDRLDDLRSTAGHYDAAAAAGFLSHILETRDQLERNANPRLALEVLLLNLPRPR